MKKVVTEGLTKVAATGMLRTAIPYAFLELAATFYA